MERSGASGRAPGKYNILNVFLNLQSPRPSRQFMNLLSATPLFNLSCVSPILETFDATHTKLSLYPSPLSLPTYFTRTMWPWLVNSTSLASLGASGINRRAYESSLVALLDTTACIIMQSVFHLKMCIG